jgi:hypothetical protein
MHILNIDMCIYSYCQNVSGVSLASEYLSLLAGLSPFVTGRYCQIAFII